MATTAIILDDTPLLESFGQRGRIAVLGAAWDTEIIKGVIEEFIRQSGSQLPEGQNIDDLSRQIRARRDEIYRENPAGVYAAYTDVLGAVGFNLDGGSKELLLGLADKAFKQAYLDATLMSVSVSAEGITFLSALPQGTVLVSADLIRDVEGFRVAPEVAGIIKNAAPDLKVKCSGLGNDFKRFEKLPVLDNREGHNIIVVSEGTAENRLNRNDPNNIGILEQTRKGNALTVSVLPPGTEGQERISSVKMKIGSSEQIIPVVHATMEKAIEFGMMSEDKMRKAYLYQAIMAAYESGKIPGSVEADAVAEALAANICGNMSDRVFSAVASAFVKSMNRVIVPEPEKERILRLMSEISPQLKRTAEQGRVLD